MYKNEVITLSSDEETETTDRIENLNSTHLNPAPNSRCIISSKLNRTSGVIVKNNIGKPYESSSKDSPEVVDLEDFIDKSNEVSSSENDQSSELDVIDLEESSDQNDSLQHEKTNTDDRKKLALVKVEKVMSNFTTANPDNSMEFSQNLKFFTEFVEYCGSLEKNQNDRFKLTRKLMKHYGETDCSYVRSQEFKQMIEKFRTKLNENNLYLIAQEITKELGFKKKINLCSKSKVKVQGVVEKIEETENSSLKLTKKRARFINKIIKNLDKLGSKIRELEEQEVDLSDEEDSTYVLLQRYRERFCQIYKRFCSYTNQVPDPNNRRIYFTESKYPAINKCIENWLNKTKCFPDFSDIVKLLESQSESLGLPSNRELFRTIADEIFQKVGIMLQRRRKYELWDLFCGLLDDGKDPADEDPDLDQTLKNNLQTRLKKEDEIFQHFAELQEKEKLEPEEVLDEEANRSPIESGNEDDEEIAEIENCLNKRMDDAIKTGNISEDKDHDENKHNTENETKSSYSKFENSIRSKETKNNYKNCKSLKWRQENSDNSVSEDSSAGTEIEKEKSGIAAEQTESSQKLNEIEKNNIITVEEKKETKTEVTPRKRVLVTKTESSFQKKKKYDGDDCNENGKSNEVFGVHCCQIFHDNFFMDFSEEKKDWEKRRVFRDLTNVNKLMELHGKRGKMSRLFSPSFLHRSFYEFEGSKTFWKKRFKVNFRLVCLKNQKCALNEQEKTKSVNSDSGGDSEEKDNSEGSGYDEGNDFIRSHGNGNEEDNNGDENKKSGGTNGEINEKQHEEDEEEEEEDEETEKEKNDYVINEELSEVFIQNIKKSMDCVQDNEAPSHNENCSDECKSIKRDILTEATDRKFNRNTKNVEGMLEKTEVMKNEKKENGTADIVEIKLEIEDLKANMGKTENLAEESETKNVNDEVNVAKERIVKPELKNKSMTSLQSKNHSRKLKLKPALEIKNKTLEPTTPIKVEVKLDKPNKWQTLQPDFPTKKPHRRNSPSDEERVKQFLMHSPSSISITPPKKLALSKPPSQAAQQALAALQNLKDISATIVRRKPKTEDEVVVVEGTAKRRSTQNSTCHTKRTKHDLPVISNVQSMASTTPTIVTVQGNVSGFEELISENGDSSTIRIASVWGSLPPTIRVFNEVLERESGCSSRQDNGKIGRKKKFKKPVEYVVLE